ncbi:NUDIX hydrolase [Oscillatoriales cyanobacterium LEGE 11467]|uniref:NUDIX hydrolase n=1 Tax=Zarconia navalis LEGE 11467 TaxID=1828826 RepID=A0A928ZAK3_9CYAN|nr:NUDIX hydrolase [Zarconia navalis]MBE9042773.1 NUDIX hydrolase [Zarconia navalis LEGE 11467]
MKKWQLLQSHQVLNHRWCKVRRDEVRLPNGEIVDDFFVNVRPDIALVFAITRDRQVVFVRQYRHGVGEILLELPAGGFDRATEEAEIAASRELTEETGYVAKKLTKLATFYDNPVKDTNQIHLFLARDVELTSEQNLDRTEEIKVVLVPISEINSKIEAGDICVSGTVTALFLGLNFLEN